MVTSEGEPGEIRAGGRRIAFRLHRGRRRRLAVVVSPDLRVVVHAPRAAGRRAIDAFLAEKAAWIARTLDRFAKFERLPAPREFKSGERLAYLGETLRLEVVPGPPGTPELDGRTLCVRAPAEGAAVERILAGWYRARAQAVFLETLAACLPAAARRGIPTPRLFIRAMRTRWGSARPPDRISLSTHLVKVAPACIEYVVMHELCHLKHPDHSPAFYALLGACLPDWRPRRDRLKRLVVL